MKNISQHFTSDLSLGSGYHLRTEPVLDDWLCQFCGGPAITFWVQSRTRG